MAALFFTFKVNSWAGGMQIQRGGGFHAIGEGEWSGRELDGTIERGLADIAGGDGSGGGPGEAIPIAGARRDGDRVSLEIECPAAALERAGCDGAGCVLNDQMAVGG
jgi:hypothetical protein